MAALLAETVHLPHGPTAVLWRLSARARRVSLRIDARTAAVVVTLPVRAGRSAGLRLLTSHAAWVEAKLAALPRPLAFIDGGVIPIGGEPHTIRHVPGGRGGAWIAAGEVQVGGDQAFLARRVADLLRNEAKRRFLALAGLIGAEAGLKPAKLVVRDTRSRWGSCTGKQTVMLNWRLIMAPDQVQRYVVAHELAHLRYMNHGASFWRLVDELVTNRGECTAWLSQRGAVLLRAGHPQLNGREQALPASERLEAC